MDMLVWIAENWATVAVCIILAAVVVWIIVSMFKNKKKGKTSCGCGCSSCPMNGSCHPKKQ